MSRDKQRLEDYLAHIAEAIERIKRYTETQTKFEFLNDSLVQDAVVRNLEIIGEASNNIEKNIPSTHRRTLNCLCRSPIKCAMLSRTGISRWTMRSYGIRFKVI